MLSLEGSQWEQEKRSCIEIVVVSLLVFSCEVGWDRCEEKMRMLLEFTVLLWSYEFCYCYSYQY